MKLDLDFALTGEDGTDALLEAIDTALNRKPLRRINGTSRMRRDGVAR